MKKIVYEQTDENKKLPELLEGYLYGLGEVCHNLFGPKGEEAIYQLIGKYFSDYLKNNMNIVFTSKNPWERYCEIIKLFTDYGYYSYVELKELSNNRYWMLETAQYEVSVWEDQKAWKRGTPACPFWAVILYSLHEIGYTIVLSKAIFNEEVKGYESNFYFIKLDGIDRDMLKQVKKVIRREILSICTKCKKINKDNGEWEGPESYFQNNYDLGFSNCICPDCAKK